jgi:hypothetical protein
LLIIKDLKEDLIDILIERKVNFCKLLIYNNL